MSSKRKSKKIIESEIPKVVSILKKHFPGAGAMELGTPYKTLVGVLLSARTRDEQVLKLLPAFFHAFPDTKTLAGASTQEIEKRINTIGMFRQKAKNLQAMAKRVEEEFYGIIPKTMEDLTSLAGVGRKTASVLLPLLFDVPALAVDTHVHRVANRLGWVQTKTPEQTEKNLLPFIPASFHGKINQVFVKFGRYICLSPKPRCYLCPLVDICPFQRKNLEAPKNIDDIRKDINRREMELQKLRAKVLDKVG